MQSFFFKLHRLNFKNTVIFGVYIVIIFYLGFTKIKMNSIKIRAVFRSPANSIVFFIIFKYLS